MAASYFFSEADVGKEVWHVTGRLFTPTWRLERAGTTIDNLTLHGNQCLEPEPNSLVSFWCHWATW
jgi:hypothetical protein